MLNLNETRKTDEIVRIKTEYSEAHKTNIRFPLILSLPAHIRSRVLFISNI